MTATNKRLLISESRGDSNQCTPCRGKPDQHDTYAFHVSPRKLGVRFLQAVVIRGNLSQDADRFRHIPLLLRKRAPDTIHSTSADRSAGPYLASLPSQSMKQGGISEAPDGDQLLGLPGPYHWHVIGTFNTCSWRPTHQSLTNTGGGYNLGGAIFSHTTPRLSQPAVSPFP
jgi:hypothetical protein